jgi:hypothetical protein
MPHLIDLKPVINAALKIGAVIPDDDTRARFQVLLAAQFMTDQTCARPLTPEEQAEQAFDEPRFAFDAPKTRLLLARRQARMVRDALAERDHLRAQATHQSHPLSPRSAMALRFAEEWSRKLHRMSFDALLEKAQFLVAERKARLRAERDEKPLFPPHEIAASNGRVWRRIVSVAGLRRVGADLHNCLAGANGQRHGYVRRLREDVMRFWALCDETNIARAALMVETMSGRVCEARSYRNAPFALEGADFAALAAAGVCSAPAAARRGRETLDHILPERTQAAYWVNDSNRVERAPTLAMLMNFNAMQPRRPVRTRS